ncbi:hypothetical protein N8K70_00125 [Microbacterium betulae]|uniref:Uncharacterized protein n=1 Tax=Microbacterium betulae TaxID=2981139 RepID=A0AA97FKE3_9MICO|nr:DUF6804 family protein [Microbacterium sp. AB]WOF23107.1 hypothetical protein N8K70_00125 [Microbacterium sp. AB]
MTAKERPPQRNAFAPGLVGAAALFFGPTLLDSEGFTVIRFVVAIFAAIVAWFALQAKQWWWAVVFAAVLVVWNPMYPFDLPNEAWVPLHLAAAVAFLVAGALITVDRAD